MVRRLVGEGTSEQVHHKFEPAIIVTLAL